ncbi:unnamed protein product [Linum tenue]|uniref:Pentatricopeptide repeat-containing protein n=4 Tax=Linum tenue TaxID=586396 RepID=A0AAV0QL03_9ROSI|nr:unnamed protein product [Linum tenue]
MYVKLRDLHSAGKLFVKMPDKDCVVWNIMISAYSHNGHPEKSVQLLREMLKSGTKADLFTALPAASSIGQLKSLGWCKELHTYVTRNELGYQVSVHNALVDMYCDCACLDYARKVFDSIIDKTVVSWSTLMKGYVKHDHSLAALSLFSKMNSVGPQVDFIAIINILPACVNTGALEQVKSLHGYSVKLGLNLLSALNTALLTSYAKCGSMDMARKIFFIEEKFDRDIIIWNSMISSHAKHGDWSQCFELYKQMKHSNLKPDEFTFLSLLTSCVNSGLVEEGRALFKEMTETYKQSPSQEHYACMVDLLGRAGLVNEAKELVESMAFKPDARIWGPLLSACKLHPNTTELAEFAAENLIIAEPRNAGNYILLSNIYAAAGEWDGVAKMRSFLRDKGLKKTPGCSWVEINGQSHEFRVADRSHPKADSIYGTLSSLELEIKAARDEFGREAKGLAVDSDLFW